MSTRNIIRAAAILYALLSLLAAGGCGTRNGAPARHPASSGLNSALAQLDAMQAPGGVDSLVFQQLKDSLRAQLLAKGAGKLVSAPPMGAPNAVDDLALAESGGLYTATWSYRNLGDYNQDSVVNVQDITPLAMHFGHTTEAGGTWDELDPVIDGDGNGTVGIADITPLAQHFNSECVRYSLKQGTSEAGPYAEFSTIAFTEAIGSGRKQFALSSLALTAGWWYVVQPVDRGENFGQAGIQKQIPPANIPPTAALTADPMSGPAPLTVAFDASGSTDVDGTIVSYSWDWTNDGIYEEVGPTPNSEFTFTAGGAFTVNLMVTDDSAGTDSTSLVIDVSQEWMHTWGQTGWDIAQAVTTNSAGEVFIGACLEISGTNSDIVLLKYSPEGDLLWQKAWGGEFDEEPVSIVTNDYGEVFIIGFTTTYGEGNSDLLLLKFSPLGQLQWSQTWGSPNQETPVGVALDGDENLIVAGFTDGFGAVSKDIFVVKFLGANSNVEWQKLWGSPMDDFASGVAAGGTSFYVSGTTYGYGQGGSDALILAGGSNGTNFWRKTWGTTLSEGARAITMEPDTGDLCLAGFAEDASTFSLDVLLLEYAQTGDLLLNKMWGGSDYDRGDAVVAFDGGDIIVGGYTKSFLDPTDADGFLFRYSSVGEMLWSRTLGGSLTQEICAAKLDGSGNLLLAGYSPDNQCTWSNVTGVETATAAVETFSGVDEFVDIVGVTNSIPFDSRDLTGTEDTGGGGEADALAIRLSPGSL
jgi:PKD repeat protein